MAQETQTGAQPRGVGWGGRWEGGSKGRGYMYTYGWFMLRFDRKQNSVKQLSFNKKIKRKKAHFLALFSLSCLMFSYWKSSQVFSGKRQSGNKSFMYIVWLNNAYLSSGTSKHLYGISHQFPFSKSLINTLFSMHINKALLVKKFLLGLKQPNLSFFFFFPHNVYSPISNRRHTLKT